MSQVCPVRRRSVLLGGIASSIAPSLGRAQSSWPNGPIRVVVPSAPGGNPDLMARLIAEPLSQALGTPVVIENRPGVASNLGTEAVIRSRPDGQTLLFGSVNNAINQSFFRNIGFDWLRDLEPIVPLYRIPNVLVVHPDLPVRSVAELVALAKAQPGRINYASPGVGTSLHLAGEMLKLRAGIDMLHVPYRGAAAAAQDMEGGRVQMMFENLPPALPRIDQGRVRALAVTSPERSPRLPQVPTMVESGFPDMGMLIWGGLFVPAGTPTPIIERLHAETVRIAMTPEFTARLTQLGSIGIERDRARFRAFTVEETRRWGEVVRASGATAE
jgi:tripartite-type tricarboxylate transporter receptor subunit TctC